MSNKDKSIAEEQWQLTPSGASRVQLAAQGLSNLLLKPDAILTSPHQRAVQSTFIAAKELGREEMHFEHTDALLPNARPEALLEQLRTMENKKVLCVGHSPQLDQFVSMLCKSSASMPICSLTYAGAASIEADLEEPDGYLNWLLTAEILSRIAHSRVPQ